MDIYFQGLILGLSYVAPIGMQNLFIINTALTQKKTRSFTTALITIFFDISLACACFFGMGALMENSKLLKMIILLVGSVIVTLIGINLIRSECTLDTSMDAGIPWFKVIASAFAVTWFNPQAVIDGTMMLGAFRASLSPEKAYSFILGVTSASCLWFLCITAFISFFSSSFNDKALKIINKSCGIIIIIYGLKLFYNFVLMLN